MGPGFSRTLANPPVEPLSTLNSLPLPVAPLRMVGVGAIPTVDCMPLTATSPYQGIFTKSLLVKFLSPFTSKGEKVSLPPESGSRSIVKLVPPEVQSTTEGTKVSTVIFVELMMGLKTTRSPVAVPAEPKTGFPLASTFGKSMNHPVGAGEAA